MNCSKKLIVRISTARIFFLETFLFLKVCVGVLGHVVVEHNVDLLLSMPQPKRLVATRILELLVPVNNLKLCT